MFIRSPTLPYAPSSPRARTATHEGYQFPAARAESIFRRQSFVIARTLTLEMTARRIAQISALLRMEFAAAPPKDARAARDTTGSRARGKCAPTTVLGTVSAPRRTPPALVTKAGMEQGVTCARARKALLFPGCSSRRARATGCVMGFRGQVLSEVGGRGRSERVGRSVASG